MSKLKIIEGFQSVKDKLLELIEIRQESLSAWSGYPYERGSADAGRINSVKEIVAEVRREKDNAVRRFTEEYDGEEEL